MFILLVLNASNSDCKCTPRARTKERRRKIRGCEFLKKREEEEWQWRGQGRGRGQGRERGAQANIEEEQHSALTLGRRQIKRIKIDFSIALKSKVNGQLRLTGTECPGARRRRDMIEKQKFGSLRTATACSDCPVSVI